MTKIKLVDGTIINATNVELVDGILKITITDGTVEEMAALFDDKSNTSLIILMTESGAESGYKKGFTSFAGIMYGADGAKTVELYQPADTTETRIANTEGAVAEVAEQNAVLAATVDSILTDIIPSLV